MFRIECFCEDSKLGLVLQAIKGLAYDVRPTPVGNAKVIGGRVQAKVNGGSIEILLAGLRQRKLKEFQASDAREIFSAQGLEGKAYSNALTRAKGAGIIKMKQRAKGTTGFRYEVTAKASASK